MNLEDTQRRFAVMGENAFKLANAVMTNQTICRLLKYQTRNPLEENDQQPNVDGIDLINKQILIVPKIYDDSIEKMSYVVILFNDYAVGDLNPEFKICTVRFDIACPYDEWLLNEKSLRPYLIMQEIDTLFNGRKLSGIGTLQFSTATPLVLSPQIGGYSMRYQIHEFN